MIPIERMLMNNSSLSTDIFVKIDGDDLTNGITFIPGTPGEIETSIVHKTALLPESMNTLLGKFNSDYQDTFHASFSQLLEFPPDWRGYSGIKSVWLQIHEWNELSESQRQALIEWIFQGGHLHLSTLTPDDKSKKTSPNETAPAQNEEKTDQKKERNPRPDIKLLENTNLDDLPSDLRKRLGPAVSTLRGSGWQFGLGEIHHIKLPALTAPECVDTIVAHVDSSESTSFFQRIIEPDFPRLINQKTYSIKRVPGEILLGIIIAYIIGLALVAAKTLNKPNRPYLIFILIPAFSTFTCIGILLTILLADGIGGNGEQVALAVVLPNQSHQALIIQDQTVKMGSLWTKNFYLPENVAFSEIPANCQGPKNCAATSNQEDRKFHASRTNFSGDYFTGRSVLSQSLQHFSFLRGGIELRRRNNDSATLEARSTFPVKVDRLWVAIEGKQYSGNLNPSGQWSPLSTNNVSGLLWTLPRPDATETDNATKSYIKALFELSQKPHAIDPDGWIAISDSPSEILVQTHPSINWERRQLIIVGNAFDALEGFKEGSAP